jgi:acyl-CoA synthetase (AMP-forming)/AMP-acid ligase II
VHNRPDIPQLLPPQHARRTRSRRRGALAAGLRHGDRPWSIALDAAVLATFVGLLCWESWEFGVDGEWEHMAAAIAVLIAGAVYAFRVFTADREDHR